MKTLFKLLILFLITFSSLFAFDKDVRSKDFSKKLIEYTLINSIHENLSVKSVDSWYLYNSNKELYESSKENEKLLNELLSNNYLNMQEQINKITEEIKNSEFYYEKKSDFYDKKNSFNVNELLDQVNYFLVSNREEDSYNLVSRFYVKGSSISEPIYIDKPIESANIKLFFEIIDIRISSLDEHFLDDIKDLNLEIDLFVKLKKVEIYNLLDERVY